MYIGVAGGIAVSRLLSRVYGHLQGTLSRVGVESAAEIHTGYDTCECTLKLLGVEWGLRYIISGFPTIILVG